MPDITMTDVAMSLASLAQDNRQPEIVEALKLIASALAAQSPAPVNITMPSPPAAAPAVVGPPAPQGDLIVTVTRTAAGKPVEYRITRV